MSAAYGIAGFVDGFVSGRNVKNSWADRKRNIEREKKFDDLKFTQDERAAQEHARRMRVYDRADQDWTKAQEEEEYWKGVYADAGAATDASMGGEGQSQPPATMGIDGVTTSTSGPVAAGGGGGGGAGDSGQTAVPQPVDPTRGVDAALGINGIPYQSRSGAAMESRMPAEMLMARNAPTEPTIPMRGALPQGPDFERQGRNPAAPVPDAQHMIQRRAQMDVQHMPPEDAGSRANYDLSRAFDRATTPSQPQPPGPDFERVGRSNPGSLQDQATVNRLRYEASPEGKADAVAAAEAEKMAAQDAATYDARLRDNIDRGIRDGQNFPIDMRKDAAKRVTGPSFEQTGRGSSPQPTAMGIGPLKSKAPASASPAAKELSQTAVDAMVETTTPAMQAASEAASAATPTPRGLTKGKPVTEAQIDKASGDFMAHYMKVGAPMVIEAMLKKGDVDKAIKFQEFLDKNETKAGMKNWSKAAFAASIGDMDKFSDEILEAYNRLDYFGDDTTIVKDASGFTYGKDGEISGAKITFKDEKTGNTFEQVFSDPNDLVRLGVTLLAPEQAFEYFYEQEKAKSAAANERGIKVETKTEAAEKARVSRIDGLAKEIFKTKSDPLNPRVDAEGNPLPPMSMEEAMAEATRIVDGGGQDGPALPPPVAYRPEG